MVDVLTIIVTHNSKKWIEKVLNKMAKSTYKTSVLVIDNASSDGTNEFIKKHHQNVEIIENTGNWGFSKANNIGLMRVLDEKYDYAFLLNHDAWIEPDTLEKLLVTREKHHEYGVISPIHLNGDGERLDWMFTKYISNPKDGGRKLLTDLLKKNEVEEIYDVDFVNAACWLISRECIDRVGLFDDALFPHYYEDRNYTKRTQYHNLKIGIVPGAFIYHDREQRCGEWVSTPFTVDQKLMAFKNKFSDPFKKNAITEMRKEINRYRNMAILSFFGLRLNSAKRNFFLYIEREKLLPIVTNSRKKYGLFRNKE